MDRQRRNATRSFRLNASAPTRTRSSFAFHRTSLAAAMSLALYWPTPLLAVGLGGIAVHSGLGEPLNAEIEVISAAPNELDSLHLGVADSAAYARAKVEYQSLLARLRFSLERRSDGNTVLRVTTAQPVNEPFVNLLLEIREASASLSRNYTFLLDPPAALAEHAAVASASAAPPPVVREPAAPTIAAQPAAPRVPPRAAGAAPGVRFASTTYGPVKRGEMLAHIAQRVKAPGVTLEQMLVALFDANPNAFVSGNINRLQAGAVLSIPTAQSASSIAQQSALAMIRTQTAEWRTGHRETTASIAYETKRIVVPAVAQTVPQAVATDDRAAELRSRIAELEKTVSELQQSLARSDEALQRARPAAAPAVSAPGLMPAVVGNALAATPGAASTGTGSAVLQPATSRADGSIGHPLRLALAGFVVALGGSMALLAQRRKKMKLAARVAELSDTEDENDPIAIAEQDVTIAPPPQPQRRTAAAPPYAAEIDMQNVDPVEEANVYLIYGRDTQAEEILRHALEQNPQRYDIYLVLLAIQARRNRPDAFAALMDELRTATDGQGRVWFRAVEIAQRFDPANPLYAVVGAAQSEPSVDVLHAITECARETAANEDLGPRTKEPASVRLALQADPTKDAHNDPARQLDLARSYQKIGDVDGARKLVQQVLREGDPALQVEAQMLLERLQAA